MYETIVVGFHKSDTGRDAVRHATELAAALGAALHLVTSFDPRDGDAAAADAERQLDAHKLAAGQRVQTHVLGGSISDVIVDVARSTGADLIVVGNKDLPGSKKLDSSVAGTVSGQAPCAVLIVPTT